MTGTIDKNFYIDRISGIPIFVPIKDGIVQEFQDHEYKGKLSQAAVGKHVNELRELLSAKLYKTWIKNLSIGKVYDETKYNSLEFQVKNLKAKLKELGSIVVVRKSDYFAYESEESYINRCTQISLKKKEAEELLVNLEIQFKAAQEKLKAAKEKVFNQHQIQF